MTTRRSCVLGHVAMASLIAACAGDDGRGEGATFGGSAPQGPITITGASAGGGESEGTGALRLDLPADDSHGGGAGDCGPSSPTFKQAFAHIWVANSVEGTVSKIDVATGEERGRYRIGPGVSDPSRTSVNLRGDVAVADRAGGIVKIAGARARRVDRDGDGVIETSEGPGDVRVWGEDECVLWRTDLPDGSGGEANAAGPRPVAWEAAVDGALCPTVNPRVWIGWYDAPSQAGEFRRLDGVSGAILDEVRVEAWGDRKHGPYGGAVNQHGDLWALGWSAGPLVRIDAETLEVERIEVAPPPGGAKFYLYGIAVDGRGRPWLAGEQTIYGYDPESGAWTHLSIPEGRMRGLQIDRRGHAFIALNGPAGLVEVDTVKGAVVAPRIEVPGAQVPVGVSIDIEGDVWVVDRDAARAFKIDPITHALRSTTGGLVAPYTYSDMTGAGLSLVTFPPEG